MAIRKESVSIWPLDSFTSSKLFQHFRTASSLLLWCFQCPRWALCSELTLYTHINPKINHELLEAPTHACPDKQSHSAHSYGGVCAGQARAKSPAQHFWETAASGRYECLQRTKSRLHQQLLTPAQEEKNNTWINL